MHQYVAKKTNKQGLGHCSCVVVVVVVVVVAVEISEVGVHATHQPSHRKSMSMVLYKMPN